MMTWRRIPRVTDRQALLPFQERARRLDRLFKRTILGLTLLLVTATLIGSRTSRGMFVSLGERARNVAYSLVGLEPDRQEIEASKRRERLSTSEFTLNSLTRFYEGTSPEMRRFFDITGMDPTTGLVVTGRANHGYLLSSKVFDRDTSGRSYRLRPSMHSVWLRQITLLKGPFSLFLVPDTPEVRASTAKIGGIVDDSTAQSTNSWGLRGPEPDPNAPIRGIVLGDSFMQGMFVGDNDTPPIQLERALTGIWKTKVSILNTGHVGYAPEQYLASLREYGPKFRPKFVVVSVCPNDFGDGNAVLDGGGDDWDEAAYNLNEIAAWCRSKTIPCLLVPVPTDPQIIGMRRDGRYPGRISNLFQAGPSWYLNPLDAFIDEHLALEPGRRRQGRPAGLSGLYNLEIADNHFSPAGCALWARLVAARLAVLVRDPLGLESKSPSFVVEPAPTLAAPEVKR